MRDVIPEEVRGNVVGKRNLLNAVVMAIAMPVFAFFVNKEERIGYLILAISATLFSILSSLSLLKIEDVPKKSIGALAALRSTLSDRNFMKLSWFFFYWNFVVMLSSPFFSYHLIKNLHVPFSYIGFTSSIGSFISILASWHYSRIADNIGHKSLLQLGITTVSITGFIWLFMGEHIYRELMIADAFTSGLGWSAIGISVLTLPMEVAGGSAVTYFLVYYTLGGLGGLFGALTGGFIGRLIAAKSFTIGELEIWYLQIFFAMCGVLRLFGVKLLDSVRVKRHVPLRKVLATPLNYIGRRLHARYMEMLYVMKKIKANGKRSGKLKRSSSKSDAPSERH